jgi:single-strand DNA-binding protein
MWQGHFVSVTVIGTALDGPSISTGHTSGRPKARASLRVVPTHAGRDPGSGIEFSESTWITVALAGALAESVIKDVRAGDRLIVTGRLRARSWRRSDGTFRTQIALLADECGVALPADAWEPDDGLPR